MHAQIREMRSPATPYSIGNSTIPQRRKRPTVGASAFLAPGWRGAETCRWLRVIVHLAQRRDSGSQAVGDPKGVAAKGISNFRAELLQPRSVRDLI
jgi:hypothetical protein